MKKINFALLAVLTVLLAVSCIPDSQSSYLDGITKITMASSGHVKGDSAYFVYAAKDGSKLRDTCIIDGYYGDGTDININENASVFVMREGSAEPVSITSDFLIKPGDKFTVYARFNNLESNWISVTGVPANQILEASSDNGGVYLKGVKIEDMGTMTLCYYTDSGSFFRGSGIPLYTKSDTGYFYHVKQYDENKKEIKDSELTDPEDTDNVLLGNCKYLAVSKGESEPFLIPVTSLIDIAETSSWEIGLSGGYYNNTVTSTEAWCNQIVMNIYNKGKTVRLKNLSRRTDDSAIVTITRNESGTITKTVLNDGWEITITKNDENASSPVVYKFKKGDEVKFTPENAEYTFSVKCTKPENCGLPAGTVIEGSHVFTAREH